MQFFFEKIPGEKQGSTTPLSFLASILLMLAMFVALNFGARAYLRNFTPNLGFWLIEQKWNLLLGLDESKDVLILGDSTANQGLIPETIEEETGLSAVNLGTVANLTFRNNVWMLNQYLQDHDPPQVVFILHSYQMWQRNASENAVNIIPFSRLGNLEVVLNPDLGVGYADYLEQRALFYTPLYSQSQSLRSLLRTVLQIPPDFRLIARQPYAISELGTYRVERQDEVGLQQDIEEHLLFLDTRVPTISAENQAGVEALRDLAEQYDFEVYLLNAPLAEEVASTPAFPAYFDPIDAYLREAFAGSEHVHYNSTIYSYPREGMESSDHMLFETAVDFTRQVIEQFLR